MDGCLSVITVCSQRGRVNQSVKSDEPNINMDSFILYHTLSGKVHHRFKSLKGWSLSLSCHPLFQDFSKEFKYLSLRPTKWLGGVVLDRHEGGTWVQFPVPGIEGKKWLKYLSK